VKDKKIEEVKPVEVDGVKNRRWKKS